MHGLAELESTMLNDESVGTAAALAAVLADETQLRLC
jgi:hypothetical protein